MKHLIFTLAVVTNICVFLNGPVHAHEGMGHGGGNGGSDIEMQLNKRAKQIGYFLKSKVGSDVFKMLNPETVLDTINSADINVIEGQVKDKYGVVRTCVNDSKKGYITCNLKRILDLANHDDILTGIVFHEILGLMELELGHEENVSLYPISSKILPYHDIVKSTPVSEAQIRPEFFGLDNRSYGLTLVNKVTKESLRLICLNDNVEIHRCRNYSLVRQAQKLQAPAVPNVISISADQVRNLALKSLTVAEMDKAIKELEALQAKKVKFLTLNGTVRPLFGDRDSTYRYGSGLMQITAPIFFITPVTAVADTVIEGGKQLINLTAYPIKGIIKAIKKAKLKSQIKKLNKKIDVAKRVMNVKGDLSIIGTTKEVSDEEYQTVLNILSATIQNIKE